MRIKKGWTRCECPHMHTYSNSDTKHVSLDDNRCAIHKCVHTWRPTQPLHFHCRHTAEGKVTSGAKAAVTQQSRESFCVKNWAFVEMLVLLNQIQTLLSVLSLTVCTSLPPSRLTSPSLPPSPCLLPALSSPLLLFCLLTCIAPYQPLPLSAAGVGEGEGKPGGADGALLQGAPGTSRLWQHQECRHARADVRQPRKLFYARDRSSFCELFLTYWLNPKEGCILVLCCSIFICALIGPRGRDKVNARLRSCFWLDVSVWFADGTSVLRSALQGCNFFAALLCF